MKPSYLSAWFALVALLSLAGCRKSTPLPPGNWQGRCPAEATGTPDTKFGPPPETYVRDRAQILRRDFVQEMEATLSAFQRETCHQLMVVTVNSLEGRSLEGFALHYASRIGLGYHRLNNGLMLLVVPSTRQTRIQVGCGLEDVISDAQATEILQRDLLPNAREGQWTDALRASLSSLMQLARNKPIPESYRPDGCRAGAGKVTK